MPPSTRRRRRPTTACVACRRKKTRCDRENPCRNCVRSKTKAPCVYEDESVPRLVLQDASRATTTSTLNTTGVDAASSTSIATTSSPTLNVNTHSPTNDETEILRKRIQHLEEQLQATTKHVPASITALPPPFSTPGSDIETTTSHIGGTFHIHHPAPLEAGLTRTISLGISNKTRLFGQSHWVNTVAPLAFPMMHILEPKSMGAASKVHASIVRAKCLARTIKAQRVPPWPCPPTPELPSKQLADELVQNYLVTIEGLYRILHVPSFLRDFESLWAPDASPNTAFLVQAKLVLALGAITHAPNFPHRCLAVRYIYEAQTYLAEPIYKPRLTITHLQIQLLLLLAKELIHIAGDGAWIAAGNVLRTAIAMGLHRDPVHLPSMPRFQAETRRRLWATILEVGLQTSVATGSPPLIAMHDFDVVAPAQLNDEALSDKEGGGEVAETEYTDASVACVLRANFEVRLKIVKHLNDLSTGVQKYEDTLQLDRELRAACKSMRQTFQLYANQPSGSTPRARFAMQACEFLMLSYLTSLHAPYFAASIHESKYAYSRKVLVDTALKMWCAAYPPSALAAGTNNSALDDQPRELFRRFTTSGSGFFRSGAFRSAFVVIEELRAQLQEDNDLGLGPVPIRTDLLTVAQESCAWSLQCLEAGEVGVKGYLVTRVMVAYIDGMRAQRKDLGPLLLRHAVEAVEKAITLLEAEAARTRQDVVDSSANEAFPASDSVEDWGFLMPSAMLFPDNQGALEWSRFDSPMQGFLI